MSCFKDLSQKRYKVDKELCCHHSDIKKTSTNKNLRTGFLIYFNYRLPDALFRNFCEEYGDPKKFFCIQSANGYQNYFANFSTDISTKSIMRNMTKYPMTRSGSFPITDEFESFYKKKNDAEHILEMVKDVTKVKRSTDGLDALPEDAKLILKKIKSWKEKVGK